LTLLNVTRHNLVVSVLFKNTS